MNRATGYIRNWDRFFWASSISYPPKFKYRYFTDIKKFAKILFGAEEPKKLLEISFYLASIIEQKYMKEEDFEEWGLTREDSLVYYYWLYRYSHTRLVNLFKYSPISFLFEHFYNEARESVLESEPALAKNKDLYSKVMREFLDIFKGEIDISNIID